MSFALKVKLKILLNFNNISLKIIMETIMTLTVKFINIEKIAKTKQYPLAIDFIGKLMKADKDKGHYTFSHSEFDEIQDFINNDGVIELIVLGNEAIGFLAYRTISLNGYKLREPSCKNNNLELELYMYSILENYKNKKILTQILNDLTTRLTDDREIKNCEKNILVRCLPASKNMKQILVNKGFINRPEFDQERFFFLPVE